jgi:hypothetical protein
MANTSRITGFTPVNFGAGPGRINVFGPYSVKAATAVYQGDLLCRDASDDGAVTPVDSGTDAAYIVGVAAETVLSGDSDRTINVQDDLHNMQFVIEATTAAATNIGQHVDVTQGSGATFASQGGSLPEHSDTLGVSGNYLNGSNWADAIAMCQLMGKVEDPQNEWGAYCKVIVRIVEGLQFGGAMA